MNPHGYNKEAMDVAVVLVTILKGLDYFPELRFSGIIFRKAYETLTHGIEYLAFGTPDNESLNSILEERSNKTFKQLFLLDDREKERETQESNQDQPGVSLDGLLKATGLRLRKDSDAEDGEKSK